MSLWVKPALSLSVDKIASVSVDVKPQLNVVITASDDEASCPNQRPADSFGAALDVNLGWNLAVQISAGINIGIFSYSLYSHTWGPYNLIDLNGACCPLALPRGSGGALTYVLCTCRFIFRHALQHVLVCWRLRRDRPRRRSDASVVGGREPGVSRCSTVRVSRFVGRHDSRQAERPVDQQRYV